VEVEEMSLIAVQLDNLLFLLELFTANGAKDRLFLLVKLHRPILLLEE